MSLRPVYQPTGTVARSPVSRWPAGPVPPWSGAVRRRQSAQTASDGNPTQTESLAHPPSSESYSCRACLGQSQTQHFHFHVHFHIHRGIPYLPNELRRARLSNHMNGLPESPKNIAAESPAAETPTSLYSRHPSAGHSARARHRSGPVRRPCMGGVRGELTATPPCANFAHPRGRQGGSQEWHRLAWPRWGLALALAMEIARAPFARFLAFEKSVFGGAPDCTSEYHQLIGAAITRGKSSHFCPKSDLPRPGLPPRPIMYQNRARGPDS
jgi:hypothetical protein